MKQGLVFITSLVKKFIIFLVKKLFNHRVWIDDNILIEKYLAFINFMPVSTITTSNLSSIKTVSKCVVYISVLSDFELKNIKDELDIKDIFMYHKSYSVINKTYLKDQNHFLASVLQCFSLRGGANLESVSQVVSKIKQLKALGVKTTYLLIPQLSSKTAWIFYCLTTVSKLLLKLSVVFFVLVLFWLWFACSFHDRLTQYFEFSKDVYTIDDCLHIDVPYSSLISFLNNSSIVSHVPQLSKINELYFENRNIIKNVSTSLFLNTEKDSLKLTMQLLLFCQRLDVSDNYFNYDFEFKGLQLAAKSYHPNFYSFFCDEKAQSYYKKRLTTIIDNNFDKLELDGSMLVMPLATLQKEYELLHKFLVDADKVQDEVIVKNAFLKLREVLEYKVMKGTFKTTNKIDHALDVVYEIIGTELKKYTFISQDKKEVVLNDVKALNDKVIYNISNNQQLSPSQFVEVSEHLSMLYTAYKKIVSNCSIKNSDAKIKDLNKKVKSFLSSFYDSRAIFAYPFVQQSVEKISTKTFCKLFSKTNPIKASIKNVVASGVNVSQDTITLSDLYESIRKNIHHDGACQISLMVKPIPSPSLISLQMSFNETSIYFTNSNYPFKKVNVFNNDETKYEYTINTIDKGFDEGYSSGEWEVFKFLEQGDMGHKVCLEQHQNVCFDVKGFNFHDFRVLLNSFTKIINRLSNEY